MAIIRYKSNRAARKKMSKVDRSAIHGGKPFKKLTGPKTRTSGRGSHGRLTTRHRGGGAKRRLRELDFGQTKQNIPAIVERVEYDPNRTAHVALLKFADGERRYVLAWEGIEEGRTVEIGSQTPELNGNRMELQNITPGLSVYNVELKPGRGGALFRAAGSGGVLMDVTGKHAQIRMNSGEIRLVPKECFANIGQVSNAEWRYVRIGSAGRKRRMGRRPQVRGKVMNPVDHPHGGGEGNQPVGMKHPKTKWGKPALGVKTRTPGKYSDALILRRRKSRKKS